MTELSELWLILYQHFRNFNNVNISDDLLVFLIMLLFSSHFSYLEILCDGGVDFEKVAGL